jgi:ectoine hydroxylase-related dioxygenase (phytanoyl-CoA dioxygenase family)
MRNFYERFLGGAIRHFDYTWFRSIPGGGTGTYPHCDIVYMGRGTSQLYTSWTPIGDISFEQGGLMLLENSHRQQAKLRPYLQHDVDAYCTNYLDAAEIESGAKTWQHGDGRLSSNPVSLREKLGGRWLTNEFHAGDVLVFGITTVHASLDNHSDRYRLSADSLYQLAGEPADERWIGSNPVAHGPAGKRGKIC